MEVWVCNVRGRSYTNPGDPMEYYCMSKAGGTMFMKHEHKLAGCGLYIKGESNG
jgi:hypothetical protein